MTLEITTSQAIATEASCKTLMWVGKTDSANCSGAGVLGGLYAINACVGVQVMEGGAYIAALLRLCCHSSESVIRRALKLITASVAKLSLQEQPENKVC